MALTAAFKFLFFHYVVEKSSEALFTDYHILEGRTSSLIPSSLERSVRSAVARSSVQTKEVNIMDKLDLLVLDTTIRPK